MTGDAKESAFLRLRGTAVRDRTQQEIEEMETAEDLRRDDLERKCIACGRMRANDETDYCDRCLRQSF